MTTLIAFSWVALGLSAFSGVVTVVRSVVVKQQRHVNDDVRTAEIHPDRIEVVPINEPNATTSYTESPNTTVVENDIHLAGV